MSFIQSFEPLGSRSARVLILGSMPGKLSLERHQYYAHPTNTFWPIMGSLFGFDYQWGYDKRVAALIRSDVALWDVMAACTRESSLDSDIVESSIIPNQFGSFLDQHKSIRHVFFNGAKAEKSFIRYVVPGLSATQADIPLTRLPSTSPAHAAMNLESKLECWKLTRLIASNV